MKPNLLRAALLSTLLSLPLLTSAQSPMLQAGPWSAGHVPMYIGNGSGSPAMLDSGPAAGGQYGVGLTELGLTIQGSGSAPFANTGTGPFNSNLCDYDGPITGPNHFLCFSPNAQGGGLIAYGAQGGATPLPLYFNINGTQSSGFPVIPLATTSQLYGGSGVAGQAQAVNVGSGLTLSGGTLSATTGNYVTGPGTTVSGYVPQYNGTSGNVLGIGLPVGLTGSNTIIQTNNAGQLSNSFFPTATNLQFGMVKPDNSTITVSGGVISTAGTSGQYNTGTSGATVPLNNGGFTQSGTATFTGTVNLDSSTYTPINNATYSRVLASLATDNYDIKDWGDAGTCSSDSDDTSAFNSAISAISTAMGGNGNVGVLTYSGSCHVCGLTIKRNVILKGNGGTITVTNGCVTSPPIASENYSTLANSGLECGVDSRVPSWFGFWDAHINCNAAGASYTGACVATYGPAQIWHGTVLIENGLNDPMVVTQDDSTGNSSTGPQCQEEGYFDDIVLRSGAGRGWLFEGPHDSVIKSITGAFNGSYSFYTENGTNTAGSIDHLGSIHTYAETNGMGIYIGSDFRADFVMIDGDQLTVPSNDAHITQLNAIGCTSTASPCVNWSGNFGSVDAYTGYYYTGTTGSTLVNWSGSSGVMGQGLYTGNGGSTNLGFVTTAANGQFTNQLATGFSGTGSVAVSLGGHDNSFVGQSYTNNTHLLYTGSGANFVNMNIYTASGETGISGSANSTDRFNISEHGNTTSYYADFPGSITAQGIIESLSELEVVSSNALQANFQSQGSNQATIYINNAAGSQGSEIQFLDAGTTKWYAGMNTSKGYAIFDSANSANAFITTSAGATTVGESGNTVTLNGNTTVNGILTGTEVVGSSATALQGNFQSSGSHQATVQINNAAGSQGSEITFLDAGTTKWTVGDNTSNSFAIYDNTQSANAISVTSSGNVSIGESSKTVSLPNIATGTSALDYLCWNASGGAVTADGSGTCLTSLEEQKDNLGYMVPDDALSEVLQLKPFWGKYKDEITSVSDHRVHAMFGAHQVESIDPRLASYDGNGDLHGVRYMEMSVLNNAAIKALTAKIDAQAKQIEDLTALVKKLTEQQLQ